MKQTFIKQAFGNNKNSTFSLDLYRAHLASDISLWKLNNTSLSYFFTFFIAYF